MHLDRMEVFLYIDEWAKFELTPNWKITTKTTYLNIARVKKNIIKICELNITLFSRWEQNGNTNALAKKRK